MNQENIVQEGIEAPIDESKIETHCYICQVELPEGPPIVSSKCGVYYHEECAKRVVRCPACGENLLEHFMNEEAKRKMTKKDRIYTILLFALPFVIIELLFGIWSMINHPSDWSIVPWLGKAFLVDIVILIVGILIAIGIYMAFGYKSEKRTVNAFVLEQKGQTPGKPDEKMYTCGYGGGRTLMECAEVFQFGEVSIPNKVAVKRENVVCVMVDRLTMVPQGSYAWVNPKFLKLLKPSKNPLPSSLEELERIWIASGRTKILPEGAGADEKVCSTCGNNLDYIAEYDAWFCTSCGKYEEEAPPEGEEGEQPLPEEELPPPEGPPPEEELPPPEGPPPEEELPPPEGEQPPPEEELPPPDEEFPPPDESPPPP